MFKLQTHGRPSVRLICVVMLLALACTATEVESARHPNLLLVSLDTTRSDHLSAYGYSRETSPNLDRLAADGVLFATAYSPTATTGPTHASLFTGVYPIRHRVIMNGLSLPESERTLAQTLRASGYDTGGIAGSFVMHGKFGYGRGFDYYADQFSPETSTIRRPDRHGVAAGDGSDRRANEATSLALEWLDGRAESNRPFFLFIHYFDPHAPPNAPPKFVQQFRRNAFGRGTTERQIDGYDAEIAYTDHEIGRLFEGLSERDLDENTLIVVTGDHGEGLMQRGYAGHGAHIYEEGVRVPLILRWKGTLSKGKVIEEPVTLVDLYPTLLELLGLPPTEKTLHGSSLSASLLGGESLDPTRPIYFQRRLYPRDRPAKVSGAQGEKLGLRVGRWKIIVGDEEGSRELFDLEQDSEELQNRAADEIDVNARLGAQLQEWRERNRPEDDSVPPLENDDRLHLEALGYVE